MIQGYEDKIVQKFEYETTAISNKNIIGTCELGKATIQLLNESNNFSELKESWIKTRFGSFYVYDVAPVQEKINIKLSCYDVKYKLDTQYDSSKHTFPCTLKSWRNSIFIACGVTYDDSNFPNSDLILNKEPDIGNAKTNRQVLCLIAQAGCSFIDTDYSDKFYFRWFTNKVHIVKDWMSLTTEKTPTSPINLVVLGRGDVEDNVFYPKTRPQNPTEFKIDNNYILDPQDTTTDEDLRETTIIPIYNRVNGFNYIIYDLSAYLIDNKLSIILGDKVKYKDIFGNELESVIMTKKIEFIGGPVDDDENYLITLSAEQIEETNTDIKTGVDVISEIKNLSVKVDKEHETITAIYDKMVDVSLSASGVGNANIINSSKGLLHKIEIFGNLELQDNSEDNNSDFKITITKESDIQEYIVEDMKNLYQIDDVHDSFIYEDGSISIIHRIGINDDNTTYVLDEYTTENLKGFDINVPGGNYTISINHQLNINVEYLKENIYTNTFATRAGVSNQIQITKDGILIESKKYTDGQLENGDNLISSINTKSSGEILIDASKLAEINANKINFNSYDFNVTTKNMKISIGEGNNKKDLINSNGVLTNLIYPGYINGSMFVGSGDYIPLGRVGGGDTADTQRNKCTFAFKLPTNYVVQSAKIYLSHAPTAFTYNYGQSSINGYSRNLKLYKGNPAYLKMHFNIDASMSYTENASYYEISNALNFTGDPNVATSCQSIDIKNYIDTDKENLLAIYDSDASVYQSNEEILGRTGSVFAYLEIIGYSKI